MTFSSLGLSADLLRAISERNYPAPTPIQQAAIPAILEGRDVWACTQSGSGKTAVFALPLLQQTRNRDRDTPLLVRTLILVPTRELAVQVGESIRLYARYMPRPTKTIIVFEGMAGRFATEALKPTSGNSGGKSPFDLDCERVAWEM
jgi:ATP-dependent RNA helicase RhlE